MMIEDTEAHVYGNQMYFRNDMIVRFQKCVFGTLLNLRVFVTFNIIISIRRNI